MSIPCQDLVQEFGRDSPQRVRREAEAAQRMAGDGAAQGFLDLQVAIGIIDEAALPGDRRLPAEAAVIVECRQKGDGDPRRLCRGQAAEREFGRIGIGRPVRLVMQVLELAHHREAGLQHLDIELGGNGLEVFRTQLEGEAVHGFPPGPETVSTRTGLLGQAQHEALMGVGMHIGDRGHRDAADLLRPPCRRASRRRSCPRHRRQPRHPPASHWRLARRETGTWCFS